jgi:hypothetical protein
LTLIGLAPTACGQGTVDGGGDTSTSDGSTVEGPTLAAPIAPSSNGSTAEDPAPTAPNTTTPDETTVEGPSSAPPNTTSSIGPTVEVPASAEPVTSPSPCVSSVPLGVGTGLEQCDNELVHRVAPALCENGLAEFAEPNPDSLLIRPEELGCTRHADCVEREYGYCRGVGVPIIGDLQCAYGCTVDADCGEGSVCHCAEPIGMCAPADCQADADCGAGFLCVQIPDHWGCGSPPRYVCQTSSDTCSISTDCATGDVCNPDNDRLQCVPRGPVCGRPFIIDGKPVVASLLHGGNWGEKLRVPRAEQLSKVDREVVGAWWSNIGLMEHASIAAFARFTRQLLQVGAPLGLVAESNQARVDETLHAQLAFGLASAYLGAAVGPGPLLVTEASAAATLQDVVRLVVREGCVGETVAALEARHALEGCTVPEVRAVLERIAHDESAHSDLAWRFLRWAIEVEPALIDSVIAECHSAANDSAACGADLESLDVASPRAAQWREHGVVPHRQSEQLRRLVIEQVVLPCARALAPPARLPRGGASSPREVNRSESGADAGSEQPAAARKHPLARVRSDETHCAAGVDV